MKLIISLLFFLILIAGCSTSHTNVVAIPQQDAFDDKELSSAHVGICIFDPSENKYLYEYQADKYFVPASNTKLFSLYAGLKYLGDSIIGIRYLQLDTALIIAPTGDPTLLHADYKNQPVIDFLRKAGKNIYVNNGEWKDEALGTGWAWDDYNDDYMSERSALPVYGNMIRWIEEIPKDEHQKQDFAPSPSFYSIPEINWKVKFNSDTSLRKFFVKREKDQNIYEITQGTESYKIQDVPFVTNGITSALNLLEDTIGKKVVEYFKPAYSVKEVKKDFKKVYSQPADSLYKPMMFRSDNFFAEQTLLMVSNEKLGIMNDEKIIDTLLNSDLKLLPTRPKWADGSGLSRFNLFTPRGFCLVIESDEK